MLSGEIVRSGLLAHFGLNSLNILNERGEVIATLPTQVDLRDYLLDFAKGSPGLELENMAKFVKACSPWLTRNYSSLAEAVAEARVVKECADQEEYSFVRTGGHGHFMYPGGSASEEVRSYQEGFLHVYRCLAGGNFSDEIAFKLLKDLGNADLPIVRDTMMEPKKGGVPIILEKVRIPNGNWTDTYHILFVDE